MATHSSILAWRIPWTGDPGGLQSMGSQRVRHNWMTNTHTHTHTHTGHSHMIYNEEGGPLGDIWRRPLHWARSSVHPPPHLSHSHRVWGKKQCRDSIASTLGPNILSRTSASLSARELETHNRTQIRQQSSASPRHQSPGFYWSWEALFGFKLSFPTGRQDMLF